MAEDDTWNLFEERAKAYRSLWDLHVHPTGHRSWRDPSEHRSKAVKIKRTPQRPSEEE
jgi:hypothetical protein